MKKTASLCIALLVSALAVQAATVTVTAPAGGESLNLGSTFLIRWTHSGDLTAANLVRLALFKGATKTGEIVVNVPVTHKQYSWKVGEYVGGTAPAGADYRIRVKSMEGGVYSDDSNPFTIQGGGAGGGLVITTPVGNNFATVKPKIAITFPAGGEILLLNRTATITWTRTGTMSDKVDLFLQYRPMGKSLMIGNQVPNGGSFTWALPGQVPPLNGQPRYKIFIRAWNSASNKWVYDTSEGFLIGVPVQAHTTKRYDLPATTVNKVRERDWHAGGAGFYSDGPQEKPDPGPGMARVGFENWVSSGGDVTAHFLYRSWLGFDIGPLPKNRTMLECRLNHAVAQVVHQNCPFSAIRFYVLNAPWDGDPLALFSVPATEVNPDDLRSVIAAWMADPSKNYGLIITGQEEVQAGYPKNVNSYIAYLNQLVLKVRFE